MGNPTTYTDELAEMVIDWLWQGKTITQLERHDERIRRRTVNDWCRDHPEFGGRYKEAMVGGAFACVDETRDIVDNLEEPCDSRKLRAWQRLEEAKRKAPHLLGDRIQHANDPNNPMDGWSADKEARLAELMQKAGGGKS